MSDLPHVTDHARVRYVQRGGVDAVRASVLQAFERGREATVNGEDARLDPVTGLALLVKDGAIVTCFEPRDVQLEAEGS